MTKAKELSITLLGILIGALGGYKNDLLITIIGISLVLFSNFFKLNDIEEEIRILNIQINTTREINKIWQEIDRIKMNKKGKTDINTTLILIFIIVLFLIWLNQKGFIC